MPGSELGPDEDPRRTDRSDAHLSIFLSFLKDTEKRITTRFDRLEGKVDERIEKLDQRVDDLERWHISEQERAGMRIADRAAQLARWQKWSIVAGTLAAAASIAQWVI